MENSQLKIDLQAFFEKFDHFSKTVLHEIAQINVKLETLERINSLEPLEKTKIIDLPATDNIPQESLTCEDVEQTSVQNVLSNIAEQQNEEAPKKRK